MPWERNAEIMQTRKQTGKRTLVSCLSSVVVVVVAAFNSSVALIVAVAVAGWVAWPKAKLTCSVHKGPKT